MGNILCKLHMDDTWEKIENNNRLINNENIPGTTIYSA